MLWQYLSFFVLLNGALGQPAIENFVPFGTRYGDLKMVRPLDSITPPISINTRFPFFGKSYDVIRVYSHGLILFGNISYSLPHQPPGSFPLRNFVCAAPYWADTDLTKDLTSDIFYREITDDRTLTQISDMIRNGFPNIPIHLMLWAFVATWYRVPGHQASPGRNTFQAIIATNGLYSFTIFAYNKLEWSVGAWGGYPQIGFNAGDQVNYWALESSFSADVTNAVQETNIGQPGQFIFLTNGNISNTQCNTTEGLQIAPFRGSMHGGYTVRLFGLCFSQSSYIVEINGQPITGCQITSVIRCTMPMIVEGRLQIEVFTTNRQLVGETDFLSVMPETNADYILSNHYALDYLPSLVEDRRLSLYFIKNNLTINYLFNVIIYEYTTQYIVTSDTFYNRTARRIDSGLNALNLSSIENLTLNFSSIFPLNGEPVNRVRSLDISFELMMPRNTSDLVIWNGAKQFIVRSFIVPYTLATSYCSAWFSVETAANTRNMTSQAPQCPCRVRTSWDSEQFGFTIDPSCNPNKSGPWNCRFHRGARGCYRRRSSTSSDVGIRCCYDNAGVLITNRNIGSGGLIARFPDPSRKLSTFRYFFSDVLSYTSCCGVGNEVLSSCNQYITHRPTGSCVNLIPLPPVIGRGDPHFSTLNNNSYTFNGHGEYTLIKSTDEKFEIQVRLARMLNSSILAVSSETATAITAFAMKNGDQSHVQFELFSQLKILEIRIDGKILEFTLMKNRDEIATSSLIYSDDQQLMIRQTDISTISISYGSNGLQFFIHLRPNFDFLDLVSIIPSSFKENRRFQGLIGGFEGLSYPNGTLMMIDYKDEKKLFSYGETWRTNSDRSIFFYRFQDSHTEHQDTSYRPTFQDDLFKKYANTSRYRSAEQACQTVTEQDQCLYDVLITNDVTMAKTHETIQAMIQQISDYTELTIADLEQTSSTSTFPTTSPPENSASTYFSVTTTTKRPTDNPTTHPLVEDTTATTTTIESENSADKRFGISATSLITFLFLPLLFQ